MANPHQALFEYCKKEKEKAMELAVSEDSKIRYNASQAVIAWDALMGQTHKYKPTDRKKFEKTKETALRIVNLMSKGEYKTQTQEKIQALELPNFN